MTELKPCPFCGAAQEIDPANENGVSLYVGMGAEAGNWHVHCHGCGASTEGYQESKRDATLRWNTRPLESVNADLLEALKELEAALLDGLCNSGVPDFDPERLERARIAARAAISLAEKSNG